MASDNSTAFNCNLCSATYGKLLFVSPPYYNGPHWHPGTWHSTNYSSPQTFTTTRFKIVLITIIIIIGGGCIIILIITITVLELMLRIYVVVHARPRDEMSAGDDSLAQRRSLTTKFRTISSSSIESYASSIPKFWPTFHNSHSRCPGHAREVNFLSHSKHYLNARWFGAIIQSLLGQTACGDWRVFEKQLQYMYGSSSIHPFDSLSVL